MRELILQSILEIQKTVESVNSMRWAHYYLEDTDGFGVCWVGSTKHAKRLKYKHLSEITKEDWNQFSDERLLMAFKLMYRVSLKQM